MSRHILKFRSNIYLMHACKLGLTTRDVEKEVEKDVEKGVV